MTGSRDEACLEEGGVVWASLLIFSEGGGRTYNHLLPEDKRERHAVQEQRAGKTKAGGGQGCGEAFSSGCFLCQVRGGHDHLVTRGEGAIGSSMDLSQMHVCKWQVTESL